LPPNPAYHARFRRDRLLAACNSDPDPGHQEAARGRRHAILRHVMTARRIDGKARALAIRERVAELVSAFEERAGRAPGLATVLVGEDPASAVYVRSKNRATAETGMVSFAHNLPVTISEYELLQLVIELNADERVDGILVQLPLPAQINATRV